MMKVKNQLIELISEKVNGNPYSSLENFALFVLKEKILNNSALPEEKLLLINDFLTDYFEFDSETDEPIGQTKEIEKMIDFLLSQ